MKKLLCILTLLVLISCKNEKADSPDTTTDASIETKENTSIFDSDLQLAIKNWNTYYKERQPGFELNNFYAVDSAKIERITGSVYGVFDKEFNTIYTDFLVFSEDGDRYIDFDSYSWSVNENNDVMFEADQEINLVNIPQQTIERIGFYGPSTRVEDAFWLDQHNVALVGNSYDSIPFIKIFNLNKNQYHIYFYKEPLHFKSEYLKERFEQMGLKFNE